ARRAGPPAATSPGRTPTAPTPVKPRTGRQRPTGPADGGATAATHPAAAPGRRAGNTRSRPAPPARRRQPRAPARPAPGRRPGGSPADVVGVPWVLALLEVSQPS